MRPTFQTPSTCAFIASFTASGNGPNVPVLKYTAFVTEGIWLRISAVSTMGGSILPRRR